MVLRKLFTIDDRTNGLGPCMFAWTPQGTFLAIAGANKRLTIVDRQGTTQHAVNLPQPTPVIDMHWSHDGSTLAVVQGNSPNVSLYSIVTKNTEQLVTGMKADVCIVRWAPTLPVLCVGNVKGGILMYNSETLKKIPIVGKHTKKIIGCAWNRRGQVALTSEDKTLSVSDAEGTNIDTVNIKGDATEVKWADRKFDNRKNVQDTTVSTVNSQKTLTLFSPETKESVVELAFNKKYGNIVNFEWYGDGYIVCGFAAGYVTVVSTHVKEIGNEVSMMKSHRDQLTGLTVNRAISKGCSIGDCAVRVFDLDDLQVAEQKSEKYEFDSEFGALSQCSWTDDGQILTVASRNGKVYGFVTRIPIMSASYGNHLMFFSSLRELSVRDVVSSTDVARIEVEIEPNFVALGEGMAAVGSINRVWYYRFDARGSLQNRCPLACLREARQVIHDVKCSSNYGALLMNDLGVSELHIINEQGGTDQARPPRSFPEKKDQGKVSCHGLTQNFYVFGTSTGLVCVFSLIDFQIVTEYRHISGLRFLKPNMQGTRIAWIDASNNGAIFNPATEMSTTIEGLPSTTENILWDPTDYSCFVAADTKSFVTYCYSPNTRYGPTATGVRKRDSTELCTTVRAYNYNPVLLFRGVVICQTASGAIAPMPLQSHIASHYAAPGDPESFHFFMEMNRLTDALAVATTPEHFSRIAERALHLLDVDLAIRVYRELSKPTLVNGLERIRHIKEKNVLLGHICAIFHQFDDAQGFFTRSSDPMLALEMRRDLMHWDQALRLAESLAPDQIPLLSKEYAQQLEFRGEHSSAVELYRKGRMTVPDVPPNNASSAALAARKTAELHNEICIGGEARCTFRMGDVRGGMRILQGQSNRVLLAECASILESMKQFEEAALLFERAEQYERAATIYIRDMKQLKAASRVIQQISSRNILTMFAKAKETQENAFAEAMSVYERAEDWDNVVRIKVEHLNDLHGAYTIVRRTRSTEAAQMVANFCRKKGDIPAAIEFLLLAKKYQEAFDLAKNSDGMSAFENALIQQVPIRDGLAPPEHREHFALIAQHYDAKRNNEMAGDYYMVAGNFAKALDKFLLVGTEEYVDKAIAVIGKAKSDQLAHKLLDYLSGEVDGEPKHPKNIFNLYIALGSYEKAGKTAVFIASREQQEGNYRPAHKILIDTCMLLQQKGIRVSTDLRRALMLLHSYIIVKHLNKPMEDAHAATRMLLRVARNIQRFPQHTATILASTVVQCLKAEYRASAYKFACMLVQDPQLREQIPEKHKKKIEQVVRKKGKEELTDPPEPTSQCPYCRAPVAETVLECAACKNTIPFCIVTGKHMVLEDWAQCPTCQFPALYSEFLKLLKHDPKCPMCDGEVNAMTLQKIETPDVKAYV